MTREEAIECLSERVSIGGTGEQNCMVVFGVNTDTLDEAFDMAISAIRQQEHFREVNKALTLDELSERNAPVFLPIKDFPNGGYWCLCENGYIIPPSGHGFMAKERPNWVFYSQKPEEDDHDERKENENVRR